MKNKYYIVLTIFFILWVNIGKANIHGSNWDRPATLKTIYNTRDKEDLEVLISRKIKNTKKRAEIIHLINTESKKYNLDPVFIATLIYVESSFNVYAKSSAGALGLMQILPATGKMIAEITKTPLKNISDLYNPKINIKFGIWYIQMLLERFEKPLFAVTAYNYGPGNVRKFKRIYKNFPVFPYIVKIERVYAKYLKELAILNSLVKSGLVNKTKIKYKL